MQISKHSQKTVLASIDKVFTAAKGKGLTDDLFPKIDAELYLIARFFKIEKCTAFILSLFISLTMRGKDIRLEILIEYLNCSVDRLRYWDNDLATLSDLLLIEYASTFGFSPNVGSKVQFVVRDDVFARLFGNMPVFKEEDIHATSAKKTPPERIDEQVTLELMGVLSRYVQQEVAKQFREMGAVKKIVYQLDSE